MATRIRFLAMLLFGLGLLTWLADHLLTTSLRTWYLRDASARSLLTVSSGRIALESRTRYGNSSDLAQVLRDLTRDERIMAIAVCDDAEDMRQATELFPVEQTCPSLVKHWRDGRGEDAVWQFVSQSPSGPSMLSVHLLARGKDTTGWVAIVQDLSAMDRRSEKTRSIILLLFAGLACAAAGITYVAARIARRAWMTDLRMAIRGEGRTDAFHPLLMDVRNLVDELANDRSQDLPRGGWTAERLKSVLSEKMHWEKIVVLANREPYIHQIDAQGSIHVQHPASGLVTALEPLLRACSGTWVAHGSGSADRQTVDKNDRVRVPPDDPSYRLRRVWLNEAEENGFYYGFSNEGLWPLCHLAHTRPHFREEDWEQYKRVNEMFADAVCAEVDTEDPVILVQDYHFALAPRMIRARLPKATIISFWHIPWPNAERFGICPWREEILDGMLGSSIMGFHTQQHCNNFLDAVNLYREARIDMETDSVFMGGVECMVRPYPISIAWPDLWTEKLPSVEQCRSEILAALGLAPDVRLGVGVDRLDYTKGIEERFLAVDALMKSYPEYRGKFSFVQIGAPSRSRIPEYQDLSNRVIETAETINARWGNDSWRPIVLLKEHHEALDIYKHYRAADLCYVSSLHDGMNLVAKEYIASRDDEHGALVLSQFAGAAKELTEALIVNPYDLGQAAKAMVAALRMSGEEQVERMKSMRRLIAQRNVYRWAGRMLLDASNLRSKQRLEGRLSVLRTSPDEARR